MEFGFNSLARKIFPGYRDSLVVRFWSQVGSMTECPQMPLNDSRIRNLKPSAKPLKVPGSHGLYLLVNPGGSRLWYLKYRINRKESRLGLGAYPDVSLADARQQRDGIRKLLAQNINLAQQRSAERATALPEETFKSVALSWHKSNRAWSDNHAVRLLASMNNHIFPIIGHLPVSELKPLILSTC